MAWGVVASVLQVLVEALQVLRLEEVEGDRGEVGAGLRGLLAKLLDAPVIRQRHLVIARRSAIGLHTADDQGGSGAGAELPLYRPQVHVEEVVAGENDRPIFVWGLVLERQAEVTEGTETSIVRGRSVVEEREASPRLQHLRPLLEVTVEAIVCHDDDVGQAVEDPQAGPGRHWQSRRDPVEHS